MSTTSRMSDANSAVSSLFKPDAGSSSRRIDGCPGQRARDTEQPSLAERELVRRLVEIVAESEPIRERRERRGQHRRGRAHHLRGHECAGKGLVGDEQVLGHRQVVERLDALEAAPNPGPGEAARRRTGEDLRRRLAPSPTRAARIR